MRLKCSQSAVQTIYFTHDQQRRHRAAPMTDIKLPAGYEDWVEVPASLARPPKGKHFVIEARYVEPHDMGVFNVPIINTARYFIPPKPKPTLPNVKPGAVVRFTHKAYGSLVQAVKWKSGGAGWHIQFRGAGNVLCETYCGDVWLLENVNADGFTVELEGL